MAEPKVRFRKDDGSSYPAWKEYPISDLFTKVGNKNKDGQNTNVITNSAEFGLIPQRDYFDKDIAVEGNTGNYTIIQTGDFVYNPRKSSYAPMGPFNCYRLEEDGIVSPLYSCLRPKGVLNPEYLLWYFQTDKWYGYVNDHGAQNGARHDRVGMTDKILMGIPVTAPCEEEQQKIADFLSSVDDVITASEEEVANLETQKKAVMKKIFSQEVRFKRADGTDFPEWEEKTFEDIFDVITDYVAAGSFADISKNVQYLDKPDYAQLVRTVDVKNSFRNKGFVYVDKRAFEYLYRVELDKDPHIILPNIGANIGEYYLVEPCDLPYERNVLGPNAIMLGTTNNIYFWAQYLGSENFQKNLALIVSSTGQPKFNKTDLRKVAMMSPCEEEQRLIADFLSVFDEAIEAAKKELELWKELKKGLLQQMFV